MKCIILAAGEGKRLRPLTFTRPKVMVTVANKPIMEWTMENAKEAGCKEFIFVVGYKSEAVRNYFGDGGRWGVDIKYVNQGEPLGTAHALGMVKKFVDDEFIVISGDTIIGVEDIKKILKKGTKIGICETKNAKEYGIVEVENKKLKKIHEKMEEPLSNMVNAGVYHFNKKIFDALEKTKKSKRGEYELTDSINLFLKEEQMECVKLKKWIDVSYPWNLLDANEKILEEIEGVIKGKVEKGAILKGKVIVGEGSTILPGSYIEGPVIIGKNCKIGPNCYIRPHTSIGNECHIGNACEIKNSIIMDGTKIPHQNYVGDSVIGQNCNLGAGTKIANLRLDKKNIFVWFDKKVDTGRRKLGAIIGDNVQTGINASINVGAIIGNNVFIGPSAIAWGNIKPYTKVM